MLNIHDTTSIGNISTDPLNDCAGAHKCILWQDKDMTKKFLLPELEEAYRHVREQTSFEKTAGLTLPENPKMLGFGQFGVVVDTGDNLIVKFSRDTQEAKTAATIIGVNYPGIWSVEGVYRIKSLNVFLIVGEKLRDDYRKSETLIDKYEHEVYRLANLFKGKPARSLFDNDPLDTATFTDKYTETLLDLITDKDLTIFIKAMNKLHKMGIEWSDLHGGNVMWKGNIPVLVDMGLSSGGSGTPRVI